MRPTGSTGEQGQLHGGDCFERTPGGQVPKTWHSLVEGLTHRTTRLVFGVSQDAPQDWAQGVVHKGPSMNYGFEIKEMAQVAKGGNNIPL